MALEDAGALLLDADHVCLLDPTPGGGGATPLRAEGERAEQAGDYLSFDGPSGTGRVVATGRSFAVPDARTSPDVAAGRAERHGLESVLFVPLHWNDAVQRVLVVSWYEHREIADADVELAELIAGTAAAGLARLEAEARRAAGSVQDHAVIRAALALNASLELSEILDTLAREAAAPWAPTTRRCSWATARRARRPPPGTTSTGRRCAWSRGRARSASRWPPARRSSPRTTSARSTCRPTPSPACTPRSPSR